MSVPVVGISKEKLMRAGLQFSETIHYQLPPDELVQDTLRRGEGKLSDSGALVINTGEFTGRSPKDKFIVRDELTRNQIDWNDFNIPIEPHFFEIIRKKIVDYLEALPEIWIRDCYACADPRYRTNIRVIAEKPSTSLFAYNMFLRPEEEELEDFDPEWQILSAPDLKLSPAECGIRQSNTVVVNFTHKMVLIAGTGYTGEVKKGIFGVLNFILPQNKKVLGMHCAANIGEQNDTALFFGLSGTGKTTLSADPARRLIGDDEHGWSNNGVFNFEGGCYAKTIDLSEEKEPDIFHAIRAGSLVENTPFISGTNKIDFSSKKITENTRVSYPINYISNAAEPSIGDIPSNIFFLTCDAYGVLPPISRLTPEQTMYQFISGYTAKVAGTETGVTEPKSTFSACFGAPFLPLNPCLYASMLGEKMRKHQVKVWLVNTGWTGGPYGVGKRISLSYTRSMITAAINGMLNDVSYDTHPVFGFAFPKTCPGVPDMILNPKNSWSDPKAYDEKAIFLASQFIQNFSKYSAIADKETLEAGPKI
jgi:phosphoenolpyruvate carboxykinase (ATP)